MSVEQSNEIVTEEDEVGVMDYRDNVQIITLAQPVGDFRVRLGFSFRCTRGHMSSASREAVAQRICTRMSAEDMEREVKEILLDHNRLSIRGHGQWITPTMFEFTVSSAPGTMDAEKLYENIQSVSLEDCVYEGMVGGFWRVGASGLE